jgi:hypothetical protein
MAEYREAGTGGFANSTVRAKESAMIHFSTYLRTKSLDYLTMTEDNLCKETLFRQFGTYLISVAKTKGGKLLKRDTAVDYCSGVTQVLKKRLKKNVIFSATETWNSDVRYDILKLVTTRCVVAGVVVKEKSKGVGRNLMKSIGKLKIKKRCFKIKIK